MKRTKKNRQAECLQTGKSERTAANAAKCANGYGQEKTGSDFRKDEGRGKPLSVQYGQQYMEQIENAQKVRL